MDKTSLDITFIVLDVVTSVYNRRHRNCISLADHPEFGTISRNPTSKRMNTITTDSKLCAIKGYTLIKITRLN